MPPPEQDLLHNRWLHVHEEDTPGETVYRPATAQLPLSRPRTGFELHPDGTLLEIGPSPTDAIQQLPGNWDLRDNVLTLRSPTAGSQRLTIASLAPDRLVVKRTT